MRVVIGITTHVEDRGVEARFCLAGQYVRAVEKAGGVPLLLPSHLQYAEPKQVLPHLDGLLLSGGGGDRRQLVPPGSSPSLRATNPARYDYEMELSLEALGRNMPILAICRGFQTLVEALGGQVLTLDPKASAVVHDQEEPPQVATHKIRIQPGSRLNRYLGCSAEVNSFHRQGIFKEPPGLVAVAWAEDGLVEAAEGGNDRGFLMGVQFHPEWLGQSYPGFTRIFEGLVQASREWAQRWRGR